MSTESEAASPLEPPPAELWADAQALSLADVRAALGTQGMERREPLFVDATTLLQQDFTDATWLVTELITRGGTALIGGLPKLAKKTWLATEIAIGVATATSVCGCFPAVAGRVAYFYAEDTGIQVRNRIRALLAGAGRHLKPGRLHLQPRGKFLDVTRDEDLALIVASCRRLGGVDLLILDPLRDISSAAEDKSDAMAPVMRRLRLLGEILGCTVLAVHHAGKPNESNGKRGGGARLRGSGAIWGSADSGIYFLDCRGDGRNSFENTVESEIKGARSAGSFTLGLHIDDDHSGEAVRAAWAVERNLGDRQGKSTKRAAETEAADDELVFAFVQRLAMRNEHHSQRALRDHPDHPVSVKRTTAALQRLIKSERLRLVGTKVHLPKAARRNSP